MVLQQSSGLRLAAIAERVGAELRGDGELLITGVNTLADATAGQISFLTNPKYRPQLVLTKATAVIVAPKQVDQYPFALLVSDNPHATFAKVVQLFDTTPATAQGIAPSVTFGDAVKLGENVSIGPNVVIGDHVIIGDNVQIGANTVIGDRVTIGDDSIIHPQVTIYYDVSLGKNVLVCSKTVLGAPGFGYANDKGKWLPIPQLGSLRIDDDTQIGAAVTIDRGALGDTLLAKNVIIDDQVHVAHNCIVGDYSCLCGQTGLAGSCHLGKYVVIGGGCAVNGHISICDNVQITGFSMVMHDITEPGVYSSGIPATTNREWRKNTVRLKQIDTLYDRVKTLEQLQAKVTPGT